METVQNKREGQEVNAEEQPLQKKSNIEYANKRRRTAYDQLEAPLKPYYPSGYDSDGTKLIGDEAFGLTPLSLPGVKRKFDDKGGTKRKKRRRNIKKTKRNRRKTKRNRK